MLHNGRSAEKPKYKYLMGGPADGQPQEAPRGQLAKEDHYVLKWFQRADTLPGKMNVMFPGETKAPYAAAVYGWDTCQQKYFFKGIVEGNSKEEIQQKVELL